MIEIPIPATLKIGGFDITIDTGEDARSDLDIRSVDGDFSSSRQRIRVRSDISSQQFSCAFQHECIHVINYVYLNNSMDEAMVSTFSHGLLQFTEEMGIRFVKGE